MVNRRFFYDHVRLFLFGGKLRQSQVAGLQSILDEWENNHGNKDDRWLAYMLATAHYETDRTFQAIKEYGGESYYTKMYDVTGMRPDLARRHGNTEPGDGPRYCGRGFVQLTWKKNYEAMSEVCGCDLVRDPDKALNLTIATKIMFHGMMHGSFTGKKLAHYFFGDKEDWRGARRIINGLDKADLIADHGRRYYAAISYTTG